MSPEEIAAMAAEAGVNLTEMPKIPVYMSGPKALNGVWCATCCVLWLGHISNDPAYQKFVLKQAAAKAKDGLSHAIVSLPENGENDNMPILQLACTVGPSVYSQTPMPVCWTHLMPFRFATAEERAKMNQQPNQPVLIPGKANWTGGKFQ